MGTEAGLSQAAHGAGPCRQSRPTADSWASLPGWQSTWGHSSPTGYAPIHILSLKHGDTPSKEESPEALRNRSRKNSSPLVHHVQSTGQSSKGPFTFTQALQVSLSQVRRRERGSPAPACSWGTGGPAPVARPRTPTATAREHTWLVTASCWQPSALGSLHVGHTQHTGHRTEAREMAAPC